MSLSLYSLSLLSICHQLFEEYEDLYLLTAKDVQNKHCLPYFNSIAITDFFLSDKGYASKIEATIKKTNLPRKMQDDIFQMFTSNLDNFEYN